MGLKSDWSVTVARAPVVTPPVWVFQTVWAVLYIAVFWVLQRGCVHRGKVLTALMLGTLWYIVFFECRSAIGASCPAHQLVALAVPSVGGTPTYYRTHCFHAMVYLDLSCVCSQSYCSFTVLLGIFIR